MITISYDNTWYGPVYYCGSGKLLTISEDISLSGLAQNGHMFTNNVKSSAPAQFMGFGIYLLPNKVLAGRPVFLKEDPTSVTVNSAFWAQNGFDQKEGRKSHRDLYIQTLNLTTQLKSIGSVLKDTITGRIVVFNPDLIEQL